MKMEVVYEWETGKQTETEGERMDSGSTGMNDEWGRGR
jgi:hypothetical protein